MALRWTPLFCLKLPCAHSEYWRGEQKEGGNQCPLRESHPHEDLWLVSHSSGKEALLFMTTNLALMSYVVSTSKGYLGFMTVVFFPSSVSVKLLLFTQNPMMSFYYEQKALWHSWRWWVTSTSNLHTHVHTHACAYTHANTRTHSCTPHAHVDGKRETRKEK